MHNQFFFRLLKGQGHGNKLKQDGKPFKRVPSLLSKYLKTFNLDLEPGDDLDHNVMH